MAVCHDTLMNVGQGFFEWINAQRTRGDIVSCGAMADK
jgi:hypothetical protein